MGQTELHVALYSSLAAPRLGRGCLGSWGEKWGKDTEALMQDFSVSYCYTNSTTHPFPLSPFPPSLLLFHTLIVLSHSLSLSFVPRSHHVSTYFFCSAAGCVLSHHNQFVPGEPPLAASLRPGSGSAEEHWVHRYLPAVRHPPQHHRTGVELRGVVENQLTQ